MYLYLSMYVCSVSTYICIDAFPPQCTLGTQPQLSSEAQLGYVSRFHCRQYPYGRAGFKPNGDSHGSYLSSVIS